MPSAPCQGCHQYRPIFANRRCAKCYVQYVEENGLGEAVLPKKCAAEGCEKYEEKGGYCDRHYRRVLDHGHTEKVKVKNPIREHPEYKNWQHLMRHAGMCEEWCDFSRFIAEVGERPSDRHWMERKDQTKPYAPDNFYWRAPLHDKSYSHSEAREYQKATRATLPDYWVGSNLKRYFGITVEQYTALLSSQQGVCAICKKPETMLRKNGKPRLLSVDHSHQTGEIRGLLCVHCNQMLGQCGDSAETLLAAACYLERGQRSGLFVPESQSANWEAKDIAEEDDDSETEPSKTLDRIIDEVGEKPKQAPATCSVRNCGKPVKARKLCAAHYIKWLRGTPMEGDARYKPIVQCKHLGCQERAKAKGLCLKHYNEYQRKGWLGMSTCSAESCDRPVTSNGMCDYHYRHSPQAPK